MKVTAVMESRERCAEAGWFAYDIVFDQPMDKAFIGRLGAIGGGFVFLEMLKRPFFKLEAEHYMIKGVQGDDFLRMAVHRDYPEELERVKSYLEKDYPGGLSVRYTV